MPTEIVSRIDHEGWYIAPPLDPSRPWWVQLSTDFPEWDEPFELSLSDQAMVRASVTIDGALRTGAATAVSLLAFPPGWLRPLHLRRTLKEAELYAGIAERGDRDRMFPAPPTNVPMRMRNARFARLFLPSDGDVLDVRFESPWQAIHPKVRRRYHAHRRNRTAHARWWRHRDGPRPTVIAIHGFGADPYWFNEWYFDLPTLYRAGADVMLFTLPFHGPRAARTSPFSGHGLFAGGFSRINEAFAQAVFDVRILVHHLLDEIGAPAVGITGISLGGHTTALLAAAEERIAFAVPNVPVASLPDLIYEWQPVGSLARAGMRALGRDLVDMRRMMAAHSPLTWSPIIPKAHRMIIGGVGDRIAPPKHSRLLWQHWDRCRLHWFPGSHVLHFDRREYLRYFERFFREIGFLAAIPGA